LESDAERWDRKYLNKQHVIDLKPDPLLIRHAGLFNPNDIVIDLACGGGRHAIYLSSLGCISVAIDCSRRAIDRCKKVAGETGLPIHAFIADLDCYRFAPQCADAVICFNYLNRKLIDNVCTALKPGGIVIFKTFNENFTITNPNFNSDYTLAPGELTGMFSDFETIEVDDSCAPETNSKSFIVARKLQV